MASSRYGAGPGRALGGRVSIDAVIFDYGKVLSGPPEAAAEEQMFAATGVERALAVELYQKHRLAYDEGELNGLAYWRTILTEGGAAATDGKVRELAALDARMWTVFDPALVAWQKRLKAAGIRTAILSNMGDVVQESICGAFDWIEGFDVRVWSYQLRLLKPSPAIFTHVLERLALRPDQCLFLDDARQNVEGAERCGMHAICYTDVASLRRELTAIDRSDNLPRP